MSSGYGQILIARRAAEERRAIAEAAEIAAAKERFDTALRSRRTLLRDAAALEVDAGPELRWASPGVGQALTLANQAESGLARLGDEVDRARAELTRLRSRIAGEQHRRTQLDALADDLRVSRAAAAAPGPEDRPSTARASADRAKSQNDDYAASLDAEQAALDAALAELSQTRGRLAREIAADGGTVALPAAQSHPDVSRREEARRRLDALRQIVATDVFERIRPRWSDAELADEGPAWRGTSRASLDQAIASLPHGQAVPAEVVEALGDLESAPDEGTARALVIRVTNVVATSTARAERARRAVDEARAIVAASAPVRSAHLAGRCADALADAEAKVGAWTDRELSELLNTRLPALRAELAAYTAEEERQASLLLKRQIARAASEAVDAARRFLLDDPSWQLIALDRPDESFPSDEYVDGFLARPVGDTTTALMVRAKADGRIETLHKVIRDPKTGLPGPEVQDAGCARLTTFVQERLGPSVERSLDGAFSIEWSVERGKGSVYRPTASEWSRIQELDELHREDEASGHGLKAKTLPGSK